MSMKRTSLLIAAASAILATGSALAAGSDQPVTDTAITTGVKAELAKDTSTSATAVHVTTKNGVVSLTGTVKSQAEKEKAEKDARAVKGVQSVDNQLEVKSY